MSPKLVRPSLFVLNALALVSSFLPASSAAAPADAPNREPAVDLNRASLAAIESSWLEIPRMCKAREFHASPVAVKAEPLSEAVARIYAVG